MLIIRTCRNVETCFEHLSVTFQKTGFDNLPDLIGRTEYGTSKSYAVDNPKYGILAGAYGYKFHLVTYTTT
uniref:hypothetical protein n=1 Tax=Alistipes putredinis TaxID=28117 RepID=UPI00349F950F